MSLEFFEAMYGPRKPPSHPEPLATQFTPVWLKHPQPGIYLVGGFIHGPFSSTAEAMASLIRHHRESALSTLTTPAKPHA